MYYITRFNQLVYSHTEIKKCFLPTVLPDLLTLDFMASIGVYPVINEKLPYDSKTQKLVYATIPTIENGLYILKATIASLTPTEILEVKKSRISHMVDGVQDYMDAVAQKKGYASMISVCSYAGTENPFQAEAILFLKWRADVWTYLYLQLARIESGDRVEPTLETVLAELPLLIIDEVTLN